MIRLLLLLLALQATFCSGCGLFRSAGQGTSQFFNRVVSSGTQRQSALDRIEENEPEYLLDTVFRKNRDRQDQEQNQNEAEARRLIAEADQIYQQGIAERTQSQSSGQHVKTLVQAANKYDQASQLWINSTLEQDALFKAGESYFFADHFKKANDSFEKLVKYYQGTRYADAVHARRFAIAQYWLELSKSSPQHPLVINWSNEERPMRDTAGAALRLLNQIRLDHATGKIADDATLALANAYFEQKRFMDAADTYEDLRINFPNSEHQFHAHLFELRARLEAYQGPHYDGTHLDTAEKLLNAIVTQFAHKADKHRDMLMQENARIRKMKAQREMAMGEYYEARGAYQAAGLHYQQVRSDFNQTPIADDAQTRLAEIVDKPARSNEPPAWVAKVFPESKPAEPLFGTSLKDQIK